MRRIRRGRPVKFNVVYEDVMTVVPVYPVAPEPPDEPKAYSPTSLMQVREADELTNALLVFVRDWIAEAEHWRADQDDLG
jgi:hypothetical protein